MSQSAVIFCSRPAAAAATGYDELAGRPGVLWRVTLPVGTTREVDVVGLGGALAVELKSNNHTVVPNGAFGLRRNGDKWTATIAGKALGGAFLNVGFTPPPTPAPGGANLGAMPIGADWGPMLLQVQVTRADGSMPGNDLGIPPEGQMDANACWAACLAWWTKAMPQALTRSQFDLIMAATGTASADGTLSPQVILRFLSSQAALQSQLIKPERLVDFLAARRMPMIIGFSSGPLGGHVNVIHAYDADKGMVTVMEPWFPDPVNDANYRFDTAGPMPVFSNKKDGTPFKFKGKHLVRPVSYYTSRPLGGTLIVSSSSALPSMKNN